MRFLVLILLANSICPCTAMAEEQQLPRSLDRSPIAVAVSADRLWCVSANQTSKSISLIDLKRRRVVFEHRCGGRPADLVWADDRTVLVSLVDKAAVVVLDINSGQIKTKSIIQVGRSPRAIAIRHRLNATAERSTPADLAFVAISADDQIAVLDWKKRQVVKRLPVGGAPAGIAVTRNNKWLVTTCSSSGEVFVHDAVTLSLFSQRKLLDTVGNLGRMAVHPDSSMCVIPHIVNRSFPVNAENIEKGWVIDNRLSELRLPNGNEPDQRQIGLDTRGDAVGDANAVAVSGDGEWLAVTCGGTHELLIFQQPKIPWPIADPGDFLPEELSKPDRRFRRLELGGRPVDIKFVDMQTAVIANYLANTVQVVNVADARLVTSIDLGGARSPTLARQGEAIFYDADRSLNNWFSCHTCHTDGHTSGLLFDTLNDGSFQTPKLTPSLRGVTQTAPWTWHGWQTDLNASIRKSLISTMHTKKRTTDDDVRALRMFLESLKFPVRRNIRVRLDKDSMLGKRLFDGKAGCINCHHGVNFTASKNFDVGLGSKRDAYPTFNPPSLRGISTRRRYLHDGRAQSLDEVLRLHHRATDLSGYKLSDSERKSLIDYLRTLD